MSICDTELVRSSTARYDTAMALVVVVRYVVVVVVVVGTFVLCEDP